MKTMEDFTYDFGKQWKKLTDFSFVTTCGCRVIARPESVEPCNMHVQYWENEA